MKRFFQERKHSCTVKLLDGADFETEVTKSTLGQDVMEAVCSHVGLAETDYFGLKFVSAKDRQLSWLDNSKTLGKQVGNGPYNLVFRVKFYPPVPAWMQEDITRYQLVLQVREDLLKERLLCAVPIYALLASYVVQAEKGDYDPLLHEASYLDGLTFMPNQPEDFLGRVKEFHKKHKGFSPADAEFHYLDNARKIPLFGMDLHDAYDGDNTNVILGVSDSGFHVIQKGREISKFSWSNVNKVYFKSKRFFLDIRVVSEVEYEDLTIGFKCRSRTELKRLYRSAIDHHTFFRRDAAVLGIQKVSFFKLGSRFRYSGKKTLQQLKNNSNQRVPPKFERVSSVRLSNANASRKADSKGEKRIVAKAMDRVPETEQETHSKEKVSENNIQDSDISPSISTNVLVVPPEDDQAPSTSKHLLAGPVVSIKICPPTPTPPGSSNHYPNEEKSEDIENSPSEDMTSDEATSNSEDVSHVTEVVVAMESNASGSESDASGEVVVSRVEHGSNVSHVSETVVTTETNIVEQGSDGCSTEEHSQMTTTTTTVVKTTTTEIVTVDEDTEEIVIVEEETKSSTEQD